MQECRKSQNAAAHVGAFGIRAMIAEPDQGRTRKNNEVSKIMNCRLSKKCQIAGNSEPQIERGIFGEYYARCPNCKSSSRTGKNEQEAMYWWNLFQKTQRSLVKQPQ